VGRGQIAGSRRGHELADRRLVDRAVAPAMARQMSGRSPAATVDCGSRWTAPEPGSLPSSPPIAFLCNTIIRLIDGLSAEAHYTNNTLQ